MDDRTHYFTLRPAIFFNGPYTPPKPVDRPEPKPHISTPPHRYPDFMSYTTGYALGLAFGGMYG